MRKIAFILSLLISSFVFSQSPHSQSKILETDFYNHKAVDYEITTPKNVVEIEEISHKNSMRLDKKMELTDTNIFKFKNGVLTYSTHKNKYLNFGNHFFYNSNYSKLLKTKNEDKEYPEEVSFKYDDKERLIEIDLFQQKFNQHTKQIFDYSIEKNSIDNYSLGDKEHKYNVKKFRLHSKTKKILQKTKIATKLSLKDKNWYYEYDTNLNVIKISYNETLNGVIQIESRKTSEYTYNENNHIISEVGNYSTSDFKFNQHYIYEYIYDKHNNWIAKFKFSTLYGYQDLFNENFKELQEVTLRKIKYKDGSTTGNINFNNAAIQNYLQKVVHNNPFKTQKIPTDGFYWVKANESQIRFYKNGKNIVSQLNFLLIIGDNFVVNDSINNITFNLKDFKNLGILKSFYKPISIAKNNDIIWWKDTENSFFSYQKGKPFKMQKSIYAKNGLDVIIYNALGEKEAVLEGYKNVDSFHVQVATPYVTYLKLNPNEEKEDIIPPGFVWKKDENNSFWIYKNGIQDTSEKINDNFYGDLIIYNKTTKETSILEDYYEKNPNTYYTVKELKGTTFWFKNNKEEIGIIHNFETYKYSKLQFAQNNTDVIIFNENEAKTYVVLNYKSSPINKLLPVINYENYKEKPSEAFLETQKIKNCKNDKNCYVNLFNIKASNLMERQHEESAQKELANYMIAIYNQNSNMLFSIGMKTKAEYLDFYQAARIYLPKKINESITNRSKSLINDYNKHMNSKKTQDAIKKNGGSIIKN